MSHLFQINKVENIMEGPNQEFLTLLLQEGSDLVAVSYKDPLFSTVDTGWPHQQEHRAGDLCGGIKETSPGFIQTIPQGSKEFFANQSNLRKGRTELDLRY